jgi:hypothetical protein
MMPIHDRIIEPQPDPLAVALGGDLAHDVPLERGVHDAVVGEPGIEQAKAVVMLGDQDEVFLPRLLRQSHPLGRVELRGIELGEELVIFRQWYLARLADPFALADLRKDAEMDEQSKAIVLEPGRPLGQRQNPFGAAANRRHEHGAHQPERKKSWHRSFSLSSAAFTGEPARFSPSGNCPPW